LLRSTEKVDVISWGGVKKPASGIGGKSFAYILRRGGKKKSLMLTMTRAGVEILSMRRRTHQAAKRVKRVSGEGLSEREEPSLW